MGIKKKIEIESAYKELARWLLINRRSLFCNADISNEAKKIIINDLNYSTDILDNRS